MYSLLMALAVLSLYSLVRLADEPDSVRWWVIYVLTTCGALYTHYFAALLIATQGIAALVWLLRQRRARAWVRWLLAQGAVRRDGDVLPAEPLDVPATELDGRVLQLGKRRFARIRVSA